MSTHDPPRAVISVSRRTADGPLNQLDFFREIELKHPTRLYHTLDLHIGLA